MKSKLSHSIPHGEPYPIFLVPFREFWFCIGKNLLKLIYVCKATFRISERYNFGTDTRTTDDSQLVYGPVIKATVRPGITRLIFSCNFEKWILSVVFRISKYGLCLQFLHSTSLGTKERGVVCSWSRLLLRIVVCAEGFTVESQHLGFVFPYILIAQRIKFNGIFNCVCRIPCNGISKKMSHQQVTSLVLNHSFAIDRKYLALNRD
mmetsp:Transcript_8367/g.18052  ORF Transcript_8367/g.18052 Transcript_8367/m.18052 type:complete len:206 (-) Transcript_8367:817-1434(-)